MPERNSVVIVSGARTAQGKLLGALKDFSAVALGAAVIKAAIERAALSVNDIEEVLMGCVLTAGLGQAPARQAALAAGLPSETPCTTINKMCGSGMKTIMLAHDGILAGTHSIYVAGGMESMTNAPYLIPKARQGYRLGHGELIDHLLWDGLEDAYDRGKAMGYFAELCAAEYQLSRKQQDHFATISLQRAQTAIKEKKFAAEIIAVPVKTKTEIHLFQEDEHPGSVKIEKIPLLPPAFMKDGTVTAANSSSIADGAAAVTLMSLHEAKKRGLTPLVKIIGHSSAAKKSSQFTTAPIDAIKLLLKKIDWRIEEVDLFEINEAFSVVTLAAMRDLNIPHEKLNIHGGGCALGHPIGATGTRIVVTLMAALKHYGLKRGIASLCIGGGEATAIAIEVI